MFEKLPMAWNFWKDQKFWNRTAFHMKQKLKSFVMIILNSNKEDIAQYEVLPTKAIFLST